ncbi:MAG: sigma-70 family RNA polymerase sigma factor [Oscillospiraceae bacterium]|nr:sigma-70 family RNA polymerase sigma factor [Oscillospiraceae bacterium]
MFATEDQKIIALFFARDERAVAETAEKYGALCMRIAEQILGSRADAEEVVNDAYFRLWKAIPPTNPVHFQAFVLTLTRRAALDRADQLSRKKRSGDRYAAALSELEQVIASPDDVQRQTEQQAVSEAIGRFLDDLPEQQRSMLLKRYWYLMTAREIAREMQLPETRVRVTLMRLRNRLREYLEKEELL